MDVKQLAAAERRDLADFLETLTPAQWEVPSLCEGWTVRQVVAHAISYDELNLGGLVGRFARGGLRLGRVNDLGIADYAGKGTDELIALLRAHAVPRGLTARFGGAVALTDGLIHQQDIRRPLGLPREVPGDRLRVILPFAMWAPVLPARRLTRGLRLAASDIGWSTGQGPEVTGAGEALLMAIAGRRDAVADLAGAGAGVLRERLTRP